MKPASPDLIPAPTETSKEFVRMIVGFSVGVGAGAAPFLGAFDFPGFKTLYSVMPFQIRFGLLGFSAFIMGLIALAVQFYAAKRISPPALHKRFGLGLTSMAVGLLAFLALWSEFTVRVPRGDDDVAVMIGTSRTDHCGCDKNVDDTQCIQDLSLDPAAIESCWGSRPLRRIGFFFTLSYLALTGGFGFLIGLLVLQRQARRQADRQTPRRRRTSGRRPNRPPPPAETDAAPDPASPES